MKVCFVYDRIVFMVQKQSLKVSEKKKSDIYIFNINLT